MYSTSKISVTKKNPSRIEFESNLNGSPSGLLSGKNIVYHFRLLLLYSWNYTRPHWLLPLGGNSPVTRSGGKAHFSVADFSFFSRSGWHLVIRICFPKRKSGNDLCYHYRFFVCSQRESNPQLVLRRHLLYPFNYENKFRIYGLFSHFGYGFHFFQFILLNDDFSFLFTLTFSAVQLETNSDLSPFCFYRV